MMDNDGLIQNEFARNWPEFYPSKSHLWSKHPAPEDKIRAQRGSPSFNVALEDALEAAARWLWDVPG